MIVTVSKATNRALNLNLFIAIATIQQTTKHLFTKSPPTNLNERKTNKTFLDSINIQPRKKKLLKKTTATNACFQNIAQQMQMFRAKTRKQ